jgi:hypothetical protein
MPGALRRSWVNAGAPSNGTSGTLAGIANKGDLLIDSTNAKLYQNSNTQASPTWTEKAASGAAIGVVGNMAAAGTSTANSIGVGTTAASIDHVHALGAHDHSGATTGGDLGAHNSAAVTLIEGTAPAGTACYIVRDNDGDTYINALVAKLVALRVAGTNVATFAGAAITLAQAVTASLGITVSAGGITVTGNSVITGDLAVTGALSFGGAWTVADTLTVDELILDTDGTAPAGTNCYAVRDNSGDLTVNAITGKQFIVAINNTDEYTFSATVLDMLANALDNCGYIILNAATAPAGTEVYLVNDNTGDLTLNALNTKSIHLAINGTDEYDFSATALACGANNITLSTGYISFTDAGYVSLGASGSIRGNGTIASAGIIRVANNTYVASARNAADGADVDMIKVNASDLIEFGASLAAHTVAGTLTLAAQQLSLSTGNITFSGAGYIAINANPASAGAIRLANTGVIAWRNAANDADISALAVNAADDLDVGCDLQMQGNTIYGNDAENGNLVLASTLHATKGYVGIPTGHEGLKIGGTADRAGTVGDNALHIFNGAAAPAGTLANGVSIYSEGGECKVLDAAGNSTTLSPHTEDGDYIIHSFSAAKGETVTIHLEKLVKAIVSGNPALTQYVEVGAGHVKKTTKFAK